MCSAMNYIWYSVLLWFHVVICYLINGNKIFRRFSCLWQQRCMPISLRASIKSSVRNTLVFADWTLIGTAFQTPLRSWIKHRTWLNVHRLSITLRSRNPERAFFFFPSPPSSFASSSLLDSTDFSSESLTKSSSSLSCCSECWTVDPASAYALKKNKNNQHSHH